MLLSENSINKISLNTVNGLACTVCDANAETVNPLGKSLHSVTPELLRNTFCFRQYNFRGSPFHRQRGRLTSNVTYQLRGELHPLRASTHSQSQNDSDYIYEYITPPYKPTFPKFPSCDINPNVYFSFPFACHSRNTVTERDFVAMTLQVNTYWNALALNAIHHTEGRTQISKPRWTNLVKWLSKLAFCNRKAASQCA
jgi:hypothetical protein